MFSCLQHPFYLNLTHIWCIFPSNSLFPRNTAMWINIFFSATTLESKSEVRSSLPCLFDLLFICNIVLLHLYWLLIIWKSGLTDKMKRSFFQAAVVSILLYGCITWTLTKWLEKKLDGNYTRMLRAIMNKSWQQQPTRHQLYGHLPPIMKTIQVRWTRHARTLLEKQERAHKWCTPMDPRIWPSKSRTTSSNIHPTAMWGYGM